MVLGIGLIVLALVGLSFGIKKKNKASVTASVILLILIAVIWAVYSYLYSKNPY